MLSPPFQNSLNPNGGIPSGEQIVPTNISWFEEVPKEFQKLLLKLASSVGSHRQCSLGAPALHVPFGLGLLICLMEDGSYSSGMAHIIYENMLLTSSRLLKKEGTVPAKVFFALEDKNSIGTIVEATSWRISQNGDGLAVIYCPVSHKFRCTRANRTQFSTASSVNAVGYNLVLWTATEYPNQLMYQIRQGQYTAGYEPDQGSPLTNDRLNTIGVYSNGKAVYFTQDNLKELNQLSETNYNTVVYRYGLHNKPLYTIPKIFTVKNIKRMDLGTNSKDLASAPLRCLGMRVLAEGNWPYLSDINLSTTNFIVGDTQLGAEGVSYMVRAGWPQLANLILDDNLFGVQGITFFCRAHWPNLCSIVFCNFKDNTDNRQLHPVAELLRLARSSWRVYNSVTI